PHRAPLPIGPEPHQRPHLLRLAGPFDHTDFLDSLRTCGKVGQCVLLPFIDREMKRRCSGHLGAMLSAAAAAIFISPAPFPTRRSMASGHVAARCCVNWLSAAAWRD